VGVGEKPERPGMTPTQDPGGRLTRRSSDRTQHRLFWAALAAPGIIWLAVLFIVPFYAIVAIAGGQVDVFGNPVAVWNPLHWSSMNYFVARFAGRRKALFLILLIAPFWISYMMRMLAWIGLLQTNGYVNKALISLHLISQPVDWLGGLGITVVLGLVYGYIPYLILVLYAGLDRIDPALIEAGRDLGLGRVRTFVRVTLPMSRQAILTGMLITVLPMLGDYFTNQLLSGTTGTTMLGNVIDDQLTSSGGVLEGQGAVFSLLFLLVLIAPMIYYVVATSRSSRSAT
jgi:ABC-type spermidine/putrescine transport system permease subunit I